MVREKNSALSVSTFIFLFYSGGKARSKKKRTKIGGRAPAIPSLPLCVISALLVAPQPHLVPFRRNDWNCCAAPCELSRQIDETVFRVYGRKFYGDTGRVRVNKDLPRGCTGGEGAKRIMGGHLA